RQLSSFPTRRSSELKVSTPSGLGYSIRACLAAGSSEAASVLPCLSVPKGEKPNSVLHHMSRPPSPMPTTVPNRDQSGLTLRTFFRSLPMSLPRQACSYEASSSWLRPAAIASATCSAASIPDSTALCEPLMRGTLTKPAEQPISAPPGKDSFGTDCQPPSVMARAP